MQVSQSKWTHEKGWMDLGPRLANPDLVLAFAGTQVLQEGKALEELRRRYPKAHLLGCSTAGEILDTQVSDETLVATAIRFKDTQIRTAETEIRSAGDSYEAGRRLARMLPKEGLAHVFVISDGQSVNGSDLARGLQDSLPSNVAVTGGLAGDGARFQHTFVFAERDHPAEGRVAVTGFYGSKLRIGYGSLGGWDPFGPHRKITKSKGNVLYELDGQPALALYKRYLGEHAAGLPATGLLFPLSIQVPGHEHEIVRTILAINDNEQSLTFAGDLPEGSIARLMKANFDRLVDGAHGAAESSHDTLGPPEAELAILVSCVGRKLVLRQRTEQELEAVREVIGPRAAMTGFYSYGEICPVAPNANCELHNQTMTITTFAET